MVVNFDLRYSHCKYSVNAPDVTVSCAVLLTEPYWLVAVQQNKPPSSGNASAITNVQISSARPITEAIKYRVIKITSNIRLEIDLINYIVTRT